MSVAPGGPLSGGGSRRFALTDELAARVGGRTVNRRGSTLESRLALPTGDVTDVQPHLADLSVADYIDYLNEAVERLTPKKEGRFADFKHPDQASIRAFHDAIDAARNRTGDIHEHLEVARQHRADRHTPVGALFTALTVLPHVFSTFEQYGIAKAPRGMSLAETVPEELAALYPRASLADYFSELGGAASSFHHVDLWKNWVLDSLKNLAETRRPIEVVASLEQLNKAWSSQTYPLREFADLVGPLAAVAAFLKDGTQSVSSPAAEASVPVEFGALQWEGEDVLDPGGDRRGEPVAGVGGYAGGDGSGERLVGPRGPDRAVVGPPGQLPPGWAAIDTGVEGEPTGAHSAEGRSPQAGTFRAFEPHDGQAPNPSWPPEPQ